MSILVLNPISDVSIYAPSATNTTLPAQPYFGVGQQGAGTLTARALLKFDVSGIPAGAVVNSVLLTLYHESSGVGTTVVQLSVRKLTKSWTAVAANDVTWERNTVSSAWDLPGGDFYTGSTLAYKNCSPANLLGTPEIFTSNGSFLTAVREWISDVSANNGVIVKLNFETTNAYFYFCSTEHGTAGYKPQLTIDYTPLPELAAPAQTSVNGEACSGSPVNITGDVTLLWSNVSNESSYAWEVWTGNNRTGTLVGSGTTAVDVTTELLNLSLTAGATYYWSVKAVGDAINYSDSSWTSGCPFIVTGVVLASPAQTSVQGQSCSGAPLTIFGTLIPNLSWSNVGNEDGFEWEVYETVGDVLIEDGSTDVNVTSISPAPLEISTSYYWRVRAIGDGVNYVNSPWVSGCSFSIVSSSASQVVVTSVSGFAVGDIIDVGISTAAERVMIIAITGSTLTVTPALSVTPSVGTVVAQADTGYTLYGTTTADRYIIENVKTGLYRLKVVANSKFGVSSGKLSPTIFVPIDGLTDVMPTVTGLTGTLTDKITLDWTDVANPATFKRFSGYEVRTSNSGWGDASYFARTKESKLESRRISSRSMTFYVRAYDKAGNYSAYSASITVSNSAPSAPSIGTISFPTEGVTRGYRVPLTVTPSDVTLVRVYAGTSSGFSPNADSMCAEMSYEDFTSGSPVVTVEVPFTVDDYTTRKLYFKAGTRDQLTELFNDEAISSPATLFDPVGQNLAAIDPDELPNISFPENWTQGFGSNGDGSNGTWLDAFTVFNVAIPHGATYLVIPVTTYSSSMSGADWMRYSVYVNGQRGEVLSLNHGNGYSFNTTKTGNILVDVTGAVGTRKNVVFQIWYNLFGASRTWGIGVTAANAGSVYFQ